MNILRSPSKRAKRVVHFGTRSCLLGTTAVLPVITVAVAIPDYDGLLPITALNADLDVTLPWWVGATHNMSLQAAWKRFTPDSPGDPDDPDLVGTRYIIDTGGTPPDGPGTVLTVKVPQAELVNGVYLLRVRAGSHPGDNPEWSDSIRIEVDTVAPGGGVLPELRFMQPNVESSEIVTDDDIDEGKLWARVAHYEGIFRGDRLTPYLNNIRLDADAIELAEGDIDDAPDAFIRIGWSEQALLDKTNGPALFSYAVMDKAGNEGGSLARSLDIQLRTFPSNLLPPLVPLSDDGLIDDADARTPVRVDIQAFTSAKDGDEIVVYWGNQTVGGNYLTTPDLANDPFIGIELLYQTIFDAGNGPIDVVYEVWRGGRLVGTSPPKQVIVDLTLAGNPDPNPETPEHENLLPPVVRGASGPPDNIIPPEDYVQDATAFIPWFAVDGSDYFADQDEIEFTWGSQTTLTITRTIDPTDLAAKADLELTVPASTIGLEGSNNIPVFYTVSRETSVPPFRNVSLSPTEFVKVTGPSTLPGGGFVDAPSFPLLNANQAIGLAQLIGPAGARYNPVQTRVRYINVVPDQTTVELFFVGYDDLFAGNLVPGAAYNPQPPHVISSDELAADSYTFNVPAIYHIAVCSQGAVEARVVFRNTAGVANSDPTRVFCDVKNPGSPDCADITP